MEPSGAGPLRIVFCGTPEFAVPTLEAVVAAGHDVHLVVTQPDRASGRGLEFSAPPVKRTALKLGLPVTQPGKIKDNIEFQEQLTAIAPDVILVVAYGRIIPQWMLDLPIHGNLNLHASLLPKYRGAAPIQWAVANGELITGNTTMRIDAGLDTGDILLQSEVPIGRSETAVDLFSVLAMDGAALMVETLRRLNAGMTHARRQDNASATLAPILTRDDGRIDFARDAQTIFNRWRGFQPWPGAFTSFGWMRCRWKARSECQWASFCADTRYLPANGWARDGSHQDLSGASGGVSHSVPGGRRRALGRSVVCACGDGALFCR